MEKEFTPYELALKLKELGFIEECFGYYTGDKKHLVLRPNISRKNTIDAQYTTAPLWQQAFDWLWNKTNKYIIPIPNNDKKWLCLGAEYETYEQTRLECLKKLIELCKNN